MMLLLTTIDAPEWQSFSESIKAKKVNQVEDLVRTENDVQLLTTAVSFTQLNDLIAESDADITLFYPQPQIDVDSRLNGEATNLADAAKSWQHRAQKLMAIQKINRRRIKLANLHQCMRTPKKAKQVLNSINIILEPMELKLSEDSVQILAVCQFFRQDPALTDLGELLFASSLPVAESSEWLTDAQYVLSSYDERKAEMQSQLERQANEISEAQAGSKSLSIEKDSLLDKLRENESATKSSDSARVQLEKQVGEMKLAHEADMASLQAERDDVAAENELILNELYKVQEALEGHLNEMKDLKAEMSHAEKVRERAAKKGDQKIKYLSGQLASMSYQCDVLGKELSSIKASALWKSGAPLRAVRYLMGVNPAKLEELQADCALLLTSDYFDVEWYLRVNKDVAELGMNPAEHYLLFGAEEGRDPGPLFDGGWYLEQYPDVAELEANPLLHYVKHGKDEGRQASLRLLDGPQASA